MHHMEFDRASYRLLSGCAYSAWVHDILRVQIRRLRSIIASYFISELPATLLCNPVVTVCTTSLTFNNTTFCPHSVFVCFVWNWEETAIISWLSSCWIFDIKIRPSNTLSKSAVYLLCPSYKFQPIWFLWDPTNKAYILCKSLPLFLEVL